MRINARNLLLLLSVQSVLLISPTSTLVAQEFPVVEVTEQHQWLKKMVGKWETTSSAESAPGQDEIVMKGTIESKMIGDFWLTNSMKAEMNGFKIDGRQTVGYDRKKGKYIGTWVDSSSDFIWHYVGTVSKDGTTLSLIAEGPSMSDPQAMAMYRDMYKFTSDDTIKLSSSVKGPDDKWIDFMTGEAKRVK